MVWKQLTADTHAYDSDSDDDGDDAEMVTPQECYRQAEPCNASRYPASGLVAGRHAFGMGADHQAGNVQVNILVHNLHVNQLNGTTQDGMLISEEAAPRIQQQAIEAQALNFHANDPEFRNCAYDPQGVDFGHKLVSRRYKAEKHEHSPYNMTTYTQCPSTAQAFSHALTLQLSPKSCKHAIFVSDGGCVDKLTSSWPSNIHLSDIESLIQKLGPQHEYHRRKVKNRRFSLYIYLVKPCGVEFSKQGRRTWSSLFQWAHSLQGSSTATSSDRSSVEVIAQVASIGLSIVGAL